MTIRIKTLRKAVAAAVLGLAAVPVSAEILVQCPGDTNGDAIPETGTHKCKHLSSGDGFVTMGDDRRLYTFGFADLTGMDTEDPDPETARGLKLQATQAAILSHEWPGPTIFLDEGDELYLTLSNVGMLHRPDLFDAHTVHWHGFPEAATVFDGVPDSSISIMMNASLTYYYKVNDPGTYMYHCHVEATEHMQMGMLANLYVRPAQDGTSIEYPVGSGNFYTKFAYNDGDGSTGYDLDIPLQLGSFDGNFHQASEDVQPLPFALMNDDYPMINGRGYPDTLDPRDSCRDPANPGNFVVGCDPFPPTDIPEFTGLGAGPDNPAVKTSQGVSSLVQAEAGQRILLRLSNVSITRYFNLGSTLPMRVVGRDAKLLRGPDGKDLSHMTSSVQLGGGETADVIIDTAGVAPGTYFLYATNLHQLSNGGDEFGGMMTEIHISAPTI